MSSLRRRVEMLELKEGLREGRWQQVIDFNTRFNTLCDHLGILVETMGEKTETMPKKTVLTVVKKAKKGKKK